MYIKDKTIYFNSFPENYIKEKGGLKNGTTRELMGDELELFINSELSKIVITNTETGESFERDISCRDYVLEVHMKRTNSWMQLWAIYWYPETKRRTGKSEEADAVAEKRGML